MEMKKLTMQKQRIWIVTGSSRGLGRALAEKILDSGDLLVATARDTGQLTPLVKRYGSRIFPLALDVRDVPQVDAAVKSSVERFGQIDLLVNNAGYGFTGAFEEMTDEDFKGQIDTNFWGVVNVTRAVLPVMRSQGSGRILQVTSVGGRNAGPGLSGYHAAKFAVEGFSEALAYEVRPLGIQVCLIEPGGLRTDWAGASMSYAKPMDDYRATVEGFRSSWRERDRSLESSHTPCVCFPKSVRHRMALRFARSRATLACKVPV
jgi:NAD(P)-dependent dehydrogenase (short-subunit alcohol dehydrogenase family)